MNEETQQPEPQQNLGVAAASELFARGASHDDYVTAGCSLTAVLVLRANAYVMHSGGTAAYLAHRGDVRALTADDTLEDAALPLLGRALGTSASLDVAVTSVDVAPGDVMILMGHRVRGDVDRRALIAHVEEAGPGEHMLVVRFDDDDTAPELAVLVDANAAAPARIARFAYAIAAIVLGIVLTTAWTL